MFVRTLALSLAAGALLSAATLSGTLYDPSGAVVPAAKITAFDTTNTASSVTSGDNGQFQFPMLLAGVYRMEVEKPGFQVLTRRALRLEASSNVKLDLQLQVGRVMETIGVKAKGVPSATLAPANVRVGGNIQPPKLVKMVRPSYPEDLKAKGIHGAVTVEAIIGRDGTVVNARLFGSADPTLAEAAVKVVKEWRYQPCLLNGVPIEFAATVVINYELVP